jgi:tripartite-type tricarboxylate transporter receptor subunit TctC
MMFSSTISGLPHVQSGRARGIAVSSAKRLPAFPSVPTIAESGVPGFDLDNMYGLYAPAGIPALILNALNAEVGRIMHSPEVMKRVAADGAEVAPPNSPSQFRDRFVQEMEMWEKLIRTSGIKVEG